jgi:DNA-binding MarR family transcriptional regulator
MMESGLDEKIGYLLIQIMKAHRGIAEQKFGEVGVHVGQEMILYKLWCENGVTQSQLADHICVEPPTITKMVQRMEASGLVERRPDPDDARVSRVYLTERSREIEAAIRRAWDDLEAATVAGLSDMEQALLRRLLMQVLHNLLEYGD